MYILFIKQSYRELYSKNMMFWSHWLLFDQMVILSVSKNKTETTYPQETWRLGYPGKCMDTLKNIYLSDHVFIYLETPRKLIIVCRKSNWIFIFSQTKQKLYSLTVRSDDWGEIFWKARAKFDSTWDLYNSMKIKNLSKFVYLHCGGLQFFSLGPYTKLIFDSTNFE